MLFGHKYKVKGKARMSDGSLYSFKTDFEARFVTLDDIKREFIKHLEFETDLKFVQWERFDLI